MHVSGDENTYNKDKTIMTSYVLPNGSPRLYPNKHPQPSSMHEDLHNKIEPEMQIELRNKWEAKHFHLWIQSSEYFTR